MVHQSRWFRLCWIAWTATLAIMVVSPAGAQSPAADGLQRWQSLNEQAYQAGDYSKGIALFEKALALGRQAFGDRDPRTLRSLNNLAFLYDAQGRYGEAEPLHQEALQASREVLGSRHPDTLTSLNNLAAVYQSQGRYGEAEPLYREALQASREVLGPRNMTKPSLVDRGCYCTRRRFRDVFAVH
jgi:tetratricopeptide (TPR) repeat protein